MSALLEISPCPKCGQKGIVFIDRKPSVGIAACVMCDSESCDLYTDDITTKITTKLAEELLRCRAIRKWNRFVKEYKK